MNNNINIAICGQIRKPDGADDTTISYTYPNPTAKNAREPWTMGLRPDMRQVRYLSDGDAYVLYATPVGYYFGIVTPSNDGRNGRTVIYVHTGLAVPTDGRAMINVLRELKDLLLIKKLWNDVAQIQRILLKLTVTSDGSVFSNNGTASSGYRTFKSDVELAQFFKFPSQAIYRNYSCVFAIPRGELKPSIIDATLQPINVGIKIAYRIVNEHQKDGVTTSVSSVPEDGKFTITYTKAGCENVKRDCYANQPRPFATKVGDELRINSMQMAGIKFQRKINFDVRDSETNVPLQSGITVDGTTLSRDNCALVDENKESITVAAEGYQRQNVPLTKLHNNRVAVILKPQVTNREVEFIRDGRSLGRAKLTVRANPTLEKYLNEQENRIYLKGNEPTYYGEDEDTGEGGSWRDKLHSGEWRKIGYVAIVVVLLLVIYLCIAMMADLYPFSTTEPSAPAPADTTTVVPAPPADDPKDIADDLDYMKKNDNWERSQLKSQKYKALFDNVKNGQADSAFVLSDYISQGKVNGRWKNIVEFYNKISQNGNTEEISRAMKRSVKDDVLNLVKLQNEFYQLERKLPRADGNADKNAGADAGRNADKSAPSAKQNPGAAKPHHPEPKPAANKQKPQKPQETGKPNHDGGGSASQNSQSESQNGRPHS